MAILSLPYIDYIQREQLFAYLQQEKIEYKIVDQEDDLFYNNTHYTIIIKDAGEGWYMGKCKQVPGAITQGRTIDEVKDNLKEAISLVLEAEEDLGMKRNKSKKATH